ncbi:MAG: cytochrome c maturation protein CcmE [candidate division Zixibacteria bacterium]|nr:cytochrome c maturation protein CcmE [candidate division Zixibacteria bacterium]
MNKKVKYIIAVAVIVVFGFIAFSSLSDQVTPYVTFAQAKESGKRVQIIGMLIDGESKTDKQSGALHFSLREEETLDTLSVIYTGGPKPGNFEQADKVVAIGQYKDGIFHSERLLVKCPSKYEGEEYEKMDHEEVL